MGKLTLPGDIPGLLRRGSPVVLAVRRPNPNDTHDLIEPNTEFGVVSTVYPGEERHVFWWNLDHDQRESGADLALDLTDATGRAHAAWWLAERHPEQLPTSGYEGTPLASCGVLWRPDRMVSSWACETWNSNYTCHFAAEASGLLSTEEVPTLADLDPNDACLLPDGSRWVDAEALRRVVLHVAAL